jgi:bacillithiol biosynthesis cysteine-adding enzyme BshC
MDNPTQTTLAHERLARIPVDVRRLPWIRRLTTDYAFQFESVASFFFGNPADPAAWDAAIARARAHPRRHEQIAAIIAAQQERRQAPPRARESAARLAEPGTVAIVTGQQAGLFGGPLFTLLKAITALRLADRVSREHGVAAVAVFWIDAEDHDWDEVRSTGVFDETLSPRVVSLPPRQTASPVPVAAVSLESSVVVTLEELERLLPHTEFTNELMAGLREVYAPGTGMADAFGRWMERILGHAGLIVYDSSDQAAKPLASGVFSRELAVPGETTRLAAAAGSNLEAMGYHAQVHGPGDGLALFRLDGERRLIRRRDSQFVVGDDGVPAENLIREAAERPGAFSPNVLLRPIVQDTILPTICYVAGPSELAYLGQLREVYQHFGVPMPLMYPRATATLLDSGAFRFLQKYDLPLEQLQRPDDGGLNELLKSQIPPAVEESFTRAEETIKAEMTRLAETMPALDPTLQGTVKTTLGRMQHDLQTLHGKMIQAAKRRDETLRRQYTRARALAFPNGHQQEREIGFIAFLNQYGPSLVDWLREELPLDLGRHWIVAI